MTVFLGYFMKEKHTKDRIEGQCSGMMTKMINKVFESLYREQLEYTPPYVNIKFFTKYMH